MQVLRQLPKVTDTKLLVGAATADDAAVYRIDAKRALVQTVDFFTPIVDDPFLYGQIAAANSLSDVYAMGGRPLTAMNLVGMPTDLVPPKVIHDILRGGAVKTKEAHCLLVGGHSIRNPEPIYGLAVTGLVSPRRMITNANARAGDLLVLTKPLGTGIVTTGIKRGVSSSRLARKTINIMRELNTPGAELAELGYVRGGTDITGYGLLGHLSSMCIASGVGAEVHTRNLPVIDPEVFDLVAQNCYPGGSRDNLEWANEFTVWNGTPDAQKKILADAQTSGGLLLCVPPRHLTVVLRLLNRYRTPCASVIGRIMRARKPRISVLP